ncbi:ABC transporter permease [Patulibacter sp. NPDC049589]|uniref:ABC transporter permease n=1 Tax=Patulibacter sp. NPDC049589 TaxID=3154731 RepID=UPI0034368DA3
MSSTVRALVRVTVGRDRVLGPVALYVVAGYTLAQAAAIHWGYASPEDRHGLARTAQGNATYAALLGPARALDDLGGLTAWRTVVVGATFAGLTGLLLAVRHTRAEEELGRGELLLAGAVGRRAPAGVALGWIAALQVAGGAVLAIGLMALGLPVVGAVLQGAAVAAVGVLFAAVAVLASQLVATARAARAVAGVALGTAFLLRAVTDAGGPDAFRWVTPLGWAEEVAPFTANDPAPLLLLVAATMVVVAVALRLQGARDHGTGLLTRTTPGPDRASARLRGVYGLTIRRQRSAVAGWGAGLFAVGAAVGAVATSADDLLGDGGTGAKLLDRAGGDPVDAFLSSTSTVVAMLACGFTLQALLRLRRDEVSGLLEATLATATRRRQTLLGAHVVVAGIGSVVVLLCAGVGLLVVLTLSGDPGHGVDGLLATLSRTPALWVLGAVSALLVGAAPRASALGWAALASCLALWIIDPLLGLPTAVSDVSPFGLLPDLPAAPFGAVATAALIAATAVVLALADAALRRRDLT